MSSFSSRLVVLQLPNTAWTVPAEDIQTTKKAATGPHKCKGWTAATRTVTSDNAQSQQAVEEEEEDGDRETIGLRDVLAAVQHMHSSMQVSSRDVDYYVYSM
jgi:flagellar hook-basal body complex protein FliE